MEKVAELKWSTSNGDLSRLQTFFGQSDNADVDMEIDGRRLLHFAADFGQNSIIEYLLSKGADINAVDTYGLTPLLVAILENHPETVKLLLSKGARTDLKSPDGRTYYDCAIDDGIKKLLIK